MQNSLGDSQGYTHGIDNLVPCWVEGGQSDRDARVVEIMNEAGLGLVVASRLTPGDPAPLGFFSHLITGL